MSCRTQQDVGLPRLQRTCKRGQALVEFAIIALVLSFMIAGFLGIMVLALGSFQNNIASENAGRVLDEHEVFVRENFATHFNDDNSDDFFDPRLDGWQDLTARQVYRFLNEYPIDGTVDGPVLYDESRLILSREDWGNRENLDLPAINQSLLGQYIFDPDLEIDGQAEKGAYRFPGAVVGTGDIDPQTGNPTGPDTVLIPLLPGPDASGIDRTFHVTSTDSRNFYPVSRDWVAPVVIGRNPDGDGTGFRIIMFHPSQPASTLTIEREIDAEGRLISQTPVVAVNDGTNDDYVLLDDDTVDNLIGDPPDGYTLPQEAPTANAQFGASSSRGRFGLGESFAFATKVRPFRAVFETSSSFRMVASSTAVKYVAEGNVIPLRDDDSVHTTDTAVEPFDVLSGAYQDLNDQSLEFQQPEVFSEDLPRYILDDTLVDFHGPVPNGRKQRFRKKCPLVVARR